LDLLTHMLCFDPTKRITVPGALEHAWLAAYHDPADEPDCPYKFEKWREIEELETMEDFREALWNEIEGYRREVRGLDHLELSALPPLSASPSSMSPLQPEVLPQPPFPPPSHPPPAAPITPAIKFEEDIFRRSPSQSDTIPTEEPTASILEIKEESASEKRKEAEDVLPEFIPSISPEAYRRRSVTTPTDPVVTYARRSSIMQPSRQGSTYNSPLPTSYVPTFIEGASGLTDANKLGQSSTIAFPSQGYVVPARSRTGSTTGGEITRKLLRTLSTVSIHESVEGLAGGLAGIAPIGKYITEVNTEADAPPSEVPRDFGISSESEDGNTESGSRAGNDNPHGASPPAPAAKKPGAGRFVVG
jgi:serine/threonine protein kinase